MSFSNLLSGNRHYSQAYLNAGMVPSNLFGWFKVFFFESGFEQFVFST